ncbi:TauD/TfdA dioxygenase family protein [Limobrevibacterium gyesilva]|uniref:TauD/TfdA family dioxygenase n=1 Tax=Limobrevibacterium gyesilva TaxID=2991712 RepID=A0AA41YTZ1_9PROT|nr:TauD/TfdA family dioxygenase [Limobrevibacterium gyesilva]MCW3476440.1 TauD/TfdA family dioxygenase [Limobrevibacterium gyesilva]
MDIRHIGPCNGEFAFVGEVGGIDLRTPLAPDTAAAIEAGMDRYAILVFHDQHVTDAQQVAFSLNFGALEPSLANVTKPQDRRLELNIADISNLDKNNRLLGRDDKRRMFNLGNMLWHSDSSFKATPAKYSLLSARAVPAKGGETQFADMRAAYAAFPDDIKAQIEDLITEHSLLYSRSLLGFAAFDDEERRAFAPVLQRLVRRHPVTGRRSAFLSSHIGTIVGWPVPEARALIRDLVEMATQPQFVHTHHWRAGDLVMWDNRVTMHRARRYNDTGEVRDMRRTTVEGTPTVVPQAA